MVKTPNLKSHCKRNPPIRRATLCFQDCECDCCTTEQTDHIWTSRTVEANKMRDPSGSETVRLQCQRNGENDACVPTTSYCCVPRLTLVDSFTRRECLQHRRRSSGRFVSFPWVWFKSEIIHYISFSKIFFFFFGKIIFRMLWVKIMWHFTETN